MGFIHGESAPEQNRFFRYNAKGVSQEGPGKLLSVVLIFVLIITSSNAFMENYQDEILAASTVFVFLWILHYRRSISLFFIAYIAFFAIWIIYQSWAWNTLNINTIIGFFCRIFVGFGVMLLLGRRFFPVFVDVVYVLACISLPFYVIGLLFPSVLAVLQGILQSAPDLFIIDNGKYSGWLRANFLVYTFSMERLSQNHGFMWEPTAFAAVLLLAIMIHLTIYDMKPDKKVWWMGVAFLTTLSTTGVIACAVVVLYWMLHAHLRTRVFIFMILLPLVLFVGSLDFVSGKIIREFNRGSDISQVNTELTTMGNSRLSSFIWDMKDFFEKPILGIGIYEETRYLGFQKLKSVNGVSDTLVRFGIIGTLVIALCYLFSFRKLTSEHQTSGSWLFLLLLLLFSWSERLTQLTLFLSFQFYAIITWQNEPEPVQGEQV